MVRMLTAALLLMVVSSAHADVGTIHKEIDQSVWKPFKDAFERLDGEALNALYAEEVLRVTPEGGVDTQGAFKRSNLSRFEGNKARGDRIALDFWLDSRQTSADTSYDVGFYRVGITAASGDVSYFYGQFHIVLKKAQGHWKIAQDWDTATIGGRPLTAADFARRPAQQF